MPPSLPLILTLLVAALLGWLFHRRSIARRAECRGRFAGLLAARRPGLTVADAGAGCWRLESRDGTLAEIDAKALTRAARVAGPRRRRRLFLAVADAARDGPRPLAGELDLKRHGPRTLPRLADEGLGLLSLDPPAARYIAAGSGDLPTIYVVDGEPRPSYLGEEHLQGAGIDVRDVHGVALAVLRQRFEESAVRVVLGTSEVASLRPADGCGGSRLLLLPEILRDGERLFAAAPTPGLLLVAADRQALDRALAEIDEPTQPLPPGVFRATSGGLTWES